MNGFNVACNMNGWMDGMTYNNGGNVLAWNSNLNYSWKLLGTMLTCIVES